MTDFLVVAQLIAELWKRGADPAEMVKHTLGREWDGTSKMLVEVGMKLEAQFSELKEIE